MSFTWLHRIVVDMETWPAPELRRRRADLGWLALSGAGDVIQIAVTGETPEDASAQFDTRRRVWAMLGVQREQQLQEAADA